MILINLKSFINESVELSINNIKTEIDVLFFHKSSDSKYFLDNINFFENLTKKYNINHLGLSVYEIDDMQSMINKNVGLSFQFPYNVLDRRFENIKMGKGKRYARSIFLQGLLASTNKLRKNVPIELIKLQMLYHSKLNDYGIDPLRYAISFIIFSKVENFIFGVDSKSHLKQILDLKLYGKNKLDVTLELDLDDYKNFYNPINWNLNDNK